MEIWMVELKNEDVSLAVVGWVCCFHIFSK